MRCKLYPHNLPVLWYHFNPPCLCAHAPSELTILKKYPAMTTSSRSYCIQSNAPEWINLPTCRRGQRQGKPKLKFEIITTHGNLPTLVGSCCSKQLDATSTPDNPYQPLAIIWIVPQTSIHSLLDVSSIIDSPWTATPKLFACPIRNAISKVTLSVIIIRRSLPQT